MSFVPDLGYLQWIVILPRSLSRRNVVYECETSCFSSDPRRALTCRHICHRTWDHRASGTANTTFASPRLSSRQRGHVNGRESRRQRRTARETLTPKEIGINLSALLPKVHTQ